MKRNNIFMWAYISFAFIAVGIRFFFEYPLWSPLVVAITFSSILFALEDLCTSLAKALKDTCTLIENFIPTSQEKAEKDLSLYEEMCEKASSLKMIECEISFLQDPLHRVSILQESFEDRKAQLAKILEMIEQLKHQMEHDRKTQNQYQNAANFLAYAGFLVLFCSLLFAALITIPVHIQDAFTVLSFAIILLANQLNITKSAEIQGKMKLCQEVLQEQEETEKNLSKMREGFNYVIEFIENHVRDLKEESVHAN